MDVRLTEKEARGILESLRQCAKIVKADQLSEDASAVFDTGQGRCRPARWCRTPTRGSAVVGVAAKRCIAGRRRFTWRVIILRISTTVDYRLRALPYLRSV